MKNRTEAAKTIFESGFNCCQAVFTPFAMEHGLTKEAALKIASGFGAGMSYHGETCGAVVGAHMVIGMLNSSENPFDVESKEKTKTLIKAYREKFNTKNGSCICKHLLGANPGVQAELIYLKENNIFNEKCPGYVEDSVKLLEDLLDH